MNTQATPLPLTSQTYHTPEGKTVTIFECSAGMTMRDFFAAAALQGILANNHNEITDPERLAKASFVVADAMIKQGPI